MERSRILTTALLVLLSLGVMLTGCSSRLYTSLVSSDDDLSGKLASLVASPSLSDESVHLLIPKGEERSEAGLLDQGLMTDNSVEQPPSPRLGDSDSQSTMVHSGQMPSGQQRSSLMANAPISEDSFMGDKAGVATFDESISHFTGDSIQGETSHIVSSSPTASSSEDIIPLEGQDFLTEMAAASGTGGATGHDVGSLASRKKGEGMRPLRDELMGMGSIGDVFFDFDAATIRSDAESTLQVNAQIFKASFENRGVVIEGHCDERGTADYNLVLGERRAQSTKQYLVDLGVSSSTIQTISYGKEKPFCNASQPDCWKKNRRGHFVLE